MKLNKLLFTAVVAITFATVNILAQSWNYVAPLPNAGASPNISVVSPTLIWSGCGPSGTPKVEKSTNGGTSWTDVTGNIAGTVELYATWGVDVNTCYVGDGGFQGGTGGNAKVYKTTNGGTSWSTIFTTGGTVGFINGIVFCRTNPNYGFIESDPPAGAGSVYWVQYTTNAGATWTQMAPPGVSFGGGQASSQSTLWMTDQNHFGYGTSATATTGSSGIVWTTNGGSTWNNHQNCAAGYFNSGCAVEADNLVGAFTTSTAVTSVMHMTGTFGTFGCVSGPSGVTGGGILRWAYGYPNCYMVTNGASGQCAAKSTDGGATWAMINSGGITGFNDIELVVVSGVVYAFAIATDGSFCSYTESLVGIDPTNTTVPTSYNLQQNYPNPFNPTTEIKYSLPKASFVTLKIYDITGREVATLVNENESTGNYVQSFDASNLSSGIYIYTLRAGDYYVSKKMSLVK